MSSQADIICKPASNSMLAHTAVVCTWAEAAREAAAADLGERVTGAMGWVVLVAVKVGRG